MSHDAVRFVVPSERHVERLVLEGHEAETRAKLRRRLLEALAPDVTLASPLEARLALGSAMAAIAPGDPLLAPLARDAGEAWMKTIDALDAAIGALRTCGARADTLAAVARAGGTAARRARTIRAAMVALDAELAKAKLEDPRAEPLLLAKYIDRASPKEVARAARASRIAARWIVDWEPCDVAWWRALDHALTRVGGGARIELPSFDLPLDPGRDRDVLEVVAEDVARALDGAPEAMRIEAALGDLRAVGDVDEALRARVALRQAADAPAQARAVVDAVHEALACGAAIEDVAIAMPRASDESLAPIRRALDDARLVAHDPRGEAPGATGIVTRALDVLAIASRGLIRGEVASLLRSRYLDPRKLAGDADSRAAAAALGDLARALEHTPTASAPDPIAALEATALRAADDDPEPTHAEARAALARRVGAVLTRAASAGTRSEHVAAARKLWAELGLDPTRGLGAKMTLSEDDPPQGIARAELRAMARDAHAWELLLGTLDAYEAAVVRLGIAGGAISGAMFRHEIARALDSSAPPPGAARAGAVRITRFAELAGERLALLVIIDANDGVLPGAPAGDALLSESLAAALRERDPNAAPATPSSRAARELASLALASSRAERVILVHRARDEQGGLLAPAPIVAWLERGGVPKSSWRASPLDGRATTPAEGRLQQIAADPDRAAILAPRARRRATIERTREGFFEVAVAEPDDLVGRVPPSFTPILARESGGIDRPLAITSLESIARCAFQGFASQVLRAREHRPVRELPDARESGTLVHEALAAAFTATQPMWSARPRDADAIRALAMQAVDDLVREGESASTLRRLAIGRLREGVQAVVEWSLADEAWDFELAEQRFGYPESASWPALRIDDGVTALALRGSIDRVDVGHRRAAVRAIDYKSSRSAVENGMKSLGETVFQIALYARVAAAAHTAVDLEGLYVPTQKKDVGAIKTRDAFGALWKQLHEAEGGRARIEARALEVVKGLREGTLLPRPRDPRACDHCALSGGCRKPRFAIAQEAEDA